MSADPCCFICLEEGKDVHQFCKCWSHETCLQTWRLQKGDILHCETCRAEYTLDPPYALMFCKLLDRCIQMFAAYLFSKYALFWLIVAGFSSIHCVSLVVVFWYTYGCLYAFNELDQLSGDTPWIRRANACARMVYTMFITSIILIPGIVTLIVLRTWLPASWVAQMLV